MSYAELAVATNYSFLRGVSHPGEMVRTAIALGHCGIGIADRNTLAGVVRAHAALKELAEQDGPLDFRLVVGARLVFADETPDIIAYPRNRRGWGHLCRLLSTGNLRAKKGDCRLGFADLAQWAGDMALILLAPLGHERTDALKAATQDHVWLGAAMPRQGRDRRRLAALIAAASEAGVPLIAVNDALYATPAQRPLHDIVTCIREGCAIHEAGRLLAANAERHLKPAAEMARLFADAPEAIAASRQLLGAIEFSLDDLRYEYPHEPVPDGWAPQAWLEHLVMQAAHARYGAQLPEKAKRLMREEFTLIAQQNYAYYFLTVHDLVRFARAQDPPILCQGRGSAANSIVCFLLGITSVDPMQHDLLFSRFVSAERREPPDIDVDFEHERREQVIQYIYERYGRDRAGIAATVIHYRPRSAIRDVGKALGLTEDVTGRLAGTIWGSWGRAVSEARVEQAGFDPHNPQMARLRDLVTQLLEAPRHLSQHVGGFVLTQGRLDELVPIHNAAMDGRTFIEWDKDDIDALGLMKVDVLALGMLTCIRKSFDLMRRHGLGDHDLKVDLGADDPAVFDMLCKGDSIGVFQVESRAQINMLPRLKPREFYDLVVQVAIVRPGPIEGDMVHPYLRRRAGIEPVEFPSPRPPHDPDELKILLGKTYGVPLFQEQAMKLAIVAAEFTPEEANGLRRAMATFRNLGTIDRFRDKMVGRMVERGYERDFAERCFKQIEGFGSYGFPESHAQSFARLVYVSSWIKCHHPEIFTCALLNSQPMGFYAPAQLVRDLIEHGGTVRPVDVNASDWDNGLEALGGDVFALRLGFRQIDGFRAEWANAIAAARATGPFADIEGLAHRAQLPRRALALLADADALGSLGLARRQALWDVRRTRPVQLPLFGAADAPELAAEPDPGLPAMPLSEEVVADYQTTRLSLKAHPLSFLRDRLSAMGVLSCAEIAAARGGARVKAAGVVLVRQRPGKGNAIFITLEDESGITNVLLWARLFEAQRAPVMAARMMIVEGEVQRSAEGVVHLMAARVHDASAMLGALSDQSLRAPADEVDRPQQPRGRHPRDVRIISRDFQ
ncbi:error-prone DNA polymerase [Sphingomonas sp.]|uniref:error-prone DNA polymerase n=1 Tax=Sphingomonas sp. TaxID=28214 RepID=UPI001D1A5C5D|nr:error-prone DNA polymerase [Sphingomonas sp.]MBX9796864.1 error-prone DNA polymerase [Sphingomonas sp.]